MAKKPAQSEEPKKKRKQKNLGDGTLKVGGVEKKLELPYEDEKPKESSGAGALIGVGILAALGVGVFVATRK